ncbi:MAG: HYR domain-containing protein, partial [Flavobacteriales bacterium]|nr:HYR domain-containing protein [Flavobacteriales bacterium]
MRELMLTSIQSLQKSTQFLMGFAALLTGIVFTETAEAQCSGGMTVNETASNATMTSLIQGTGVTITNFTVTQGVDHQVSSFTNVAGSGNPLNIANGVLLSTGRGNTASGQNNSSSTSWDNGVTFSDPDLVMLDPLALYDVVIVEFDVVPKTDTMQLAFQWGSEEYLEYTCSDYNDVFAFLVSGPGLAGPFSNSAVNFAQLPDGTPVSIGSVNQGSAGVFGDPANCTSLANSAYFINNTGNQCVQADGITTNLRVRGTVTPCSTYHVKCILADAGDNVWDSWVWLDGFSSLGQAVSFSTVNAGQGLVEGCNSVQYRAHRTGDLSVPLTVTMTYSGTATNGVDYTGCPASLSFGSGVADLYFNVTPTVDGTLEGTEVITINASWNVCASPFSITHNIDIDDPLVTITCPADIVVNPGPGCTGASVTYTDPTATDECGPCPAPTSLAGYTLLGTYNNHTYFIANSTTNWTTANNNAIAQGAHLVTINDAAEQAWLQSNGASVGWIGYTDQANEGTWVWVTGETSSYTNWATGQPDNSSSAEHWARMNNTWSDRSLVTLSWGIIEFECSMSRTSGPASGSTFPMGTTTITYSATNGQSTANCSFNVTVQDMIPPTITTCPANVTTPAASGACSAAVTVGALAATDNCGIASITNSFNGTSNASGTYPAGITNVVWTVTDTNGNTATCTTVVNVQDMSPPTGMTCPPNYSATVGSGSCTAAVTVASPTATDNCGLTFSNSFNGTSNASGNYPVGVTTVTWTATDVSGNTATCSHTVTVTDLIAPTITCPSNITQAAGSGACTASVTVPAPVTADNCSVASITNNFNGTNNASGTYPIGTTTVVWTVTDASGNTATCSHTVTVTASGTSAVAWASAVNSATSCTYATEQAFWQTLNNISASGDDLSKPGSTGISNTNAFSLNDIANNGYIVATVAETNKDRYFGMSATDAGNGRDGIDYAVRLRDDGTYRVYENGTNMGSFGSYAANDVFKIAIENNVVKYYRNNTLFYTSTVVPASASYYVDCAMDQQNSTLNNIYLTNPTCGSFTAGAQNLSGTLSYQWRVNGTNVGTNSSNYSNTSLANGDQVTVVVSNGTCSVTSPAIQITALSASCSASNITATAGAGLCTAAVTVPNPTVTTSCSTYTITNSFNGTTNANGNYPVGVTTVTFTVASACGTLTTCSITVTVTDTQNPTITCPTTQTLVLNSSCAGVLGDYRSLATVADNCTASGSLTVTQSPAIGTAVSGVGTTVVTLTVTDASGNSANCTFNVNRVDTTVPTITCPAAQTIVLDASCAGVLGDYTSLATVADNCTATGALTVTQSPIAGAAVSGVGTTVVTLTVTDASGNSANCTFNVNRVDTTVPTITCPAAQTIVLDASCAGVLGDYTSLATVADNCTATGALTVTQSPVAGAAVSGVGTTVVTLTVTDASGNSANCTFNVNRVDTTVPTITCPAAQTLVLNSSCAGVLGDYRSLATVADNCTASGSLTVTQSPVAGAAVSGVGTTVVTLTVTDASGNSANCTFNVNRVDTTVPTITCPAAQTLVLNSSCAGVLGDYTSLATVADNCTATGALTVTQSPVAGAAVSGVGTTVVTLTVTDASGNSANCTFNVNRVDTTVPTITCPAAQTLVLNSSCAGVLGDYTSLATVADNCTATGALTVTQSPVAGAAVSGVGTTVVTLTVTDA